MSQIAENQVLAVTTSSKNTQILIVPANQCRW